MEHHSLSPRRSCVTFVQPSGIDKSPSVSNPCLIILKGCLPSILLRFKNLHTFFQGNYIVGLHMVEEDIDLLFRHRFPRTTPHISTVYFLVLTVSTMSFKINSFDGLEPHIARELGYLGFNPAWSCVNDPRFCYFLYIPKRYYDIEGKVPLIVPVHGSGRNPEGLRRKFAALAEEHGCAVLAPLFPVGLIDPNDVVNYKMIKYREIRYDHILLAMVDEAHCRFGKIETEKFLLYGFSGGGQFVHRFTYLHPERVQALACGAPGTQTLWDMDHSFPRGVQDIEQVFEQSVDWAKIKAVPTMFIAGDADTDCFHAIARGRCIDGSPVPKDGRYGGTVRLEQNWRLAGANCFMHTVPGAAHRESQMLGPVKQFFDKCLQQEGQHEAISLSNDSLLLRKDDKSNDEPVG